MLALYLSWSTSTHMNSSIKMSSRAITPPQRATLNGAQPDSCQDQNGALTCARGVPGGCMSAPRMPVDAQHSRLSVLSGCG